MGTTHGYKNVPIPSPYGYGTHGYPYPWVKLPSLTPATPGPAPVTPGSSLGSLDWPHRPTLVFSAHFVLTRAHPGRTSRSVTHPQIAPDQARLTSEFFSNEFPENKLQARISHPSPLRRPTPSSVNPQSRNFPSWNPSVRPVPAHAPHVRASDPHTPELPQGSALIPNVTPRPDQM